MRTQELEERAGAEGSRKRDPAAVRADILAVAAKAFADHGLSGGRVDEIAARTRTSKRMIYYYFGDKNALYRSVLEEAYRRVRVEEESLHLADLPPIEALHALASFTFDHHRRNRDFIRLVMIENIHRGDFLRQSENIAALNRPAIDRVAALLARGKAESLFRPEIAPLTLHWLISALATFNVSNEQTFSCLFGDDLWSEAGQVELGAECGDIVLRYVLTDSTLAAFRGRSASCRAYPRS